MESPASIIDRFRGVIVKTVRPKSQTQPGKAISVQPPPASPPISQPEVQITPSEITPTIPIKPTKSPKAHLKDPAMLYRKEARRRKNLLTPTQQALLETHLNVNDQPKQHIIIPEEPDMREMMRGISPDNQARILEAIEKFNKKGIGDFSALARNKKRQRQREYRLVAADKYRILMVDSENPNGSPNNGVHNFEIYEIGLRGEVFKSER